MASIDIADDIRKWVNKCSLGNDRFKTPHFKGKIINNVPALKKLGKQLMRLEEFAFDVETTGLRVKYKYPEGDKIVGIAVSWGREHTYYIPIFHEEYLDECLSEKIVTKYLKPVFEREDVTLIGHNPIFDLHVLCNMGINVVTPYIFDTMIACWMINENVLKKLENLVKHYYGYNKYDLKQVLTTVPLSLRKEYGYGSTDFCCSISEIPILGLYCMEDTYWSWKIHVDVLDELEEQKLETFFYEKYMYFNQVIFNMERRGVKVDIPALKKMQKMAEKDLEDLQYQIYEIAGIEFNVNSNDQLRELLYGYKKYAPVYEEVKEYQYDANGEPVYYKSGKNKGQQKFKLKKNKDKIVGERFTGNQHILDVSFCFPVLAKTETGLPKTDMDTFEKILEKEYKKDKRKQEGQELLELLIKHSKLSTLKGTFMDGMLAEIYPDGKIHTGYAIFGTDSGRLASTEPNLMNLPRPVEPDIDDYEFWAKYEIRNVFIPDSEDEVIQVHDYTNLEAMLQAEYSGDELLIEMFREKYDVHGYTAVKVFKLNCSPNEAKKMYPQKRQLAKSIRFALQYGGTEFAIARNAGISKEEARDSVNDYYTTFKGEAEYKVRQKNFAHKYGFVYSLMGRRRHLEEINSNNYKMVGYLERVALNYPNQSGAADIMITAQLLVEKDERLKKLGYRQIMQVHDELIGIVPKENVEKSIKIVKEIMETCVKLKHVELIADGDYSEVSYAKAK